MKKLTNPASKKGQTAVEYILLLAVVVGVSVLLKAPVSRYLVGFFGIFNSRALNAAVKPTSYNYNGQTLKGCSSSTGGNAGGQSCE